MVNKLSIVAVNYKRVLTIIKNAPKMVVVG